MVHDSWGMVNFWFVIKGSLLMMVISGVGYVACTSIRGLLLENDVKTETTIK